MNTDTETLYPIKHKKCGMTAFYYQWKPKPFEKLLATRIVMFTGARPAAGQSITCDSCHQMVAMQGDLEITEEDT